MPPLGRSRGTANPRRLFDWARHWPKGHLSGVPPEVDGVRDASHRSLHDPFEPTMAEKALMPCDGASFGLDHCIGLPTPCAPCITVCRRIKHAQQVSISSAFLRRSHVGGTELWSTGGLCSYAACTHMQSA